MIYLVVGMLARVVLIYCANIFKVVCAPQAHTCEIHCKQTGACFLLGWPTNIGVIGLKLKQSSSSISYVHWMRALALNLRFFFFSY